MDLQERDQNNHDRDKQPPHLHNSTPGATSSTNSHINVTYNNDQDTNATSANVMVAQTNQDTSESDASDRYSPNIIDSTNSLRRRSTTRNRKGKRLRAMHPTEDSSSSSSSSYSDTSLEVIDVLHFGAQLQPSINRPQFNAKPSTSTADSRLPTTTAGTAHRFNTNDNATTADESSRAPTVATPAEINEENEVEEDCPEIVVGDFRNIDSDDSDNSFYQNDNELGQDDRALENYFDQEENIISYYYGIDDELPNYKKYDPTPETFYPRPEWQTCRALKDRRLGLNKMNKGIGSRSHNPFWFQRYACDSLFFIQRLIMSDKLKEHTGCVNSINFNTDGNLLCSGSDDKTICIWDWQRNRLKKKLISGHDEGIFQSCWFNDDTSIITTSRDGTVRLLDLKTEQSDLLHAQREEIHCFAFTSPKTVATCSLDASVHEIDTRTRNVNKLFVVKTSNSDRLCSLHTINSHPIDTTKLLVAGTSPYIYLYDSRMLKKNAQDEVDPLTTFCPQDLISTHNIVTSVAYNSIGSKILASFNDEDLYVFDSRTFNCEHKYRGHRNSKTIKGCLWFGDNFVLSGSDDGYIYGWDVESEHIVCSFHGDKSGAVNSLAMHPTMPVLAASGLDDDVKIWTPTSHQWPQTLKGIRTRICRNVYRRTVVKELSSGLRGDDSDIDRDEYVVVGDDDLDDEDDEDDEDDDYDEDNDSDDSDDASDKGDYDENDMDSISEVDSSESPSSEDEEGRD